MQTFTTKKNRGNSIEVKKKNFRVNLKGIKNDYDLYLMMVPMVLSFLLFAYKPMTGLVIAFKDYSPFRGIWKSNWVGFQYFIEYFTGPYAARTILNTFIISLSTLFLGFPMPIILALLLNEVRVKWFKKTIQTFSYVPHFISVVVVCSMVVNFLSPSTGIVNTMLKWFHINPIYFLSIPAYFVPMYVIMAIWKNTGYDSIIYIAALTSISAELYEASEVDGAGRWKQFLNITLPSLKPTIIIMLLIRLGGILNVGYESIILLYNPSTYKTADIISTFVYRVGLAEGRYDFATAVGMINSVATLIIVVIANKFSNKYAETGLW